MLNHLKEKPEKEDESFLEKVVYHEITYLSYNREDVQSVTVGVFPVKGRYFRQKMQTKDGFFYSTTIKIPVGISFYHLFVNDDFESPVGDAPGVMSPMDPFKRISINLESDIFCPVIFQGDVNYVEGVGFEIKAVSLHETVDKLAIIDEDHVEWPMIKSTQFKYKKFWNVKLNRKVLKRFVIKVETQNSIVYLHKENVYRDTPDFEAAFSFQPKDEIQSIILPNEVGYQVFTDRFNPVEPNLQKVSNEWNSDPDYYSRFGGSIKGVTDKLEYLSELGIGFIYLNPIFKSINSHGYDVIDYMSVNTDFGKESDLTELVEKAHANNIKVILDIPLNHSSTDFFAFKDIEAKQSASAYASWFEIRQFPIRVEDNPGYSCWNGYKEYPQFNFENKDVRKYFKEVSQYWLKHFDIDGWRIDSSSEIPYDFIMEFVEAARELKPHAYIMAENWHDDREVLNYKVNGITNYGLYWNVILPFFTKKIRVRKLAHDIMDHYWKRAIDRHAYSWNFLSNHDLPRFYTLTKDKNNYSLAVALLFALPGIPVLYYGEEIKMEGGQDPDNRKGMQWDKLEDNCGQIEELKYLIKLRKANKSVFAFGDLEVPYVDEKSKVMVVSRKSQEMTVHFLFNFSENKTSVSLNSISDSSHFLDMSDNPLIAKVSLKGQSYSLIKEY